MKYINFVLSSAEEGVAKPDPEIFNCALLMADCNANEAVMIGDRLDNDIYPAKKIGMKTIRVNQGMAVYQTCNDDEHTPDYTVNNLTELLDLLK